MRENMGVYRGKTKDGKWVEGCLLKSNNGRRFIVTLCDSEGCFEGNPRLLYAEVLPETVGQWTGKRDCKRTTEYPEGQRIFDNDVINCWGGEYFNGIYEFNQTLVVKDAYDIVALCEFEYVEVIGNIHDNPELVKE